MGGAVTDALIAALVGVAVATNVARAEIVSPFPAGTDWWDAARAEPVLRVDVADLRLHDVDGLGVTGVRARLRGRRFGMVAAVHQLRAPVGVERRWYGEVSWREKAGWRVAAGGAYHRVAIDGFGHDSYASGSARAYAAVRAGLWLGYEVTEWAGSGREAPRSTVAAVWDDVPEAVVRLYARFHPDVGAGVGIEVMLKLARRFGVTMGFDEATRTFAAALRFHARGADAAAVVRHHPVLGTSRGAAVGWER